MPARFLLGFEDRLLTLRPALPGLFFYER